MKNTIVKIGLPIIILILFGSFQFASAQITILGSAVASPPATSCTNTNIDVSVQLGCINAAHLANTFTVVGSTITITVNYTLGIICLPAIVNVTQTVNLGTVPAGTYTLIINGQINSFTQSTRTSSLTVNGCCPYTTNFTTSVDSICPGDSAYFTNTSVGTFVSNDWYKNNVFQTTNQNYADTFQRIGTNFIKLVLSDGTCIDSAIKTVYVNPLPSVNLGNDTSFCMGRSLSLSVGAGFDSIRWSTNKTTQGIAVISAGTYSVDVYSKGCVNSDTVNVTSRPSPSVDLGPDTGICSGTSFILDATSAGLTYRWQDNSTSPTFTVQNPGTYSVTVTNMDNCSDYDEIRVSRYPEPVVDLGEDSIACEGDTVFLDGTINGAASYIWQNGSGSPTFNATTTNIYWVLATDTNGCKAIDSVSIGFINCNPGISEYGQNQIQSYPNPAKNRLNLKTDFQGSSVPYEIYGISGNKLDDGLVVFDNSGRGTIDVNQLKSGIYLLQLVFESSPIQTKFVKE